MKSDRVIEFAVQGAALALLLVAPVRAEATTEPPSRPPEIVVRDRGFDWADAGVGAAACLGLSCLVAAAHGRLRRARLQSGVASTHEKGATR